MTDAELQKQFIKKLGLFILLKLAIAILINRSAKYARKHAN